MPGIEGKNDMQIERFVIVLKRADGKLEVLDGMGMFEKESTEVQAEWCRQHYDGVEVIIAPFVISIPDENAK